MSVDPAQAPGVERGRTLLVNTGRGARMLSASQLPWFLIHPPRGYGVLTTRGRKTGKRRRRCVRAIRQDDKAYLVGIKGKGITGWVKNALADPEVELRLRGGRFRGRAREVTREERDEAKRIYCEDASWFEYLEYGNWRPGRPTREKMRELHRTWFDKGTPLVVELRPR